MQHQLPMAEIDPFGQPGGSGGVEHRGTGILVEVREADDRRGITQARFILGGEAWRQRAIGIVQQNAGAQVRQLLVDGVQQRQELAVGQDRPRAAVVQRVRDLLGARRTFTIISTAPIIGTAK